VCRTVSYLLAGGIGSRLNVLVWDRAKPAVPFGGIYRIIDFTLSNLMYSQMRHVAILTQYQSESLVNHIQSGVPWRLDETNGGVTILGSAAMAAKTDYAGTADAVSKNLKFAEAHNAKDVLILAGDHIYKMDYRSLLAFHQEKGALLTIGMIRVPKEDISNYGIARVNEDCRIIEWQEKPDHAKSNLASMGIYVFNFQFLKDMLSDLNKHDFGYDIVKAACQTEKVYAYLFKGYWADVGTLRAYWHSNMDILNPTSGLDLQKWAVATQYNQNGRDISKLKAKIGRNARVSNSIIPKECAVEGTVVDSILSPGVHIEKGATVIDSILLHGVTVQEDAHIYEVIADEGVTIGVGARLGIGGCTRPNQEFPQHVFTGLTLIGKGAVVPPRIHMERNIIIAPYCTTASFKQTNIEEGGYIQK
jgi:glucose-1-phosphate adenylyltransferase